MLPPHHRFAAIPKGCACAMWGMIALIAVPLCVSCRAISSTLDDAEYHSSPALDQATALQQRLGANFRLHRSRQFILVSNAAAGTVEKASRTLEQLHEEFYQQSAAIGLPVRPLWDRLICVLFDRRVEYEHYLLNVERDRTEWSSGYYSHATNVVALHHDRENPAIVDAQRKLERAATTMPADADAALEAAAELATLHKTRHEAAHQFLYNSGVLVRGRAYPLWLDEGLATLFETGPTEVNPYRLAIYRRMQGEGSLMPLRALLGADLETIEPAEMGRFYTQAWGVTFFLWNHRPDRLVAYVQSLNATEPDTDAAGALRQLFDADFERAEGEVRAFLDAGGNVPPSPVK